jgi:hypothetical protein
MGKFLKKVKELATLWVGARKGIVCHAGEETDLGVTHYSWGITMNDALGQDVLERYSDGWFGWRIL